MGVGYAGSIPPTSPSARRGRAPDPAAEPGLASASALKFSPAAHKPAGASPSRADRWAVLWLAHDTRRKTRFFKGAEAFDRQASARLG